MSARFVYWMNVSLDLFIERDDSVAAHQPHADFATPDGAGMAVLHPQHDLFALVRCRQSGIKIGGPGIGIIPPRADAPAIALGV